jgi:hypothetical protein
VIALQKRYAPHRSPYVIILSADEHFELIARPAAPERLTGTWPMSVRTSTPSGIGADVSASSGWPV